MLIYYSEVINVNMPLAEVLAILRSGVGGPYGNGVAMGGQQPPCPPMATPLCIGLTHPLFYLPLITVFISQSVSVVSILCKAINNSSGAMGLVCWVSSPKTKEMWAWP